MRDPKSWSCFGNTGMINKLFPQEHRMNGINQDAESPANWHPYVPTSQAPCCWWGAQGYFSKFKAVAAARARGCWRGKLELRSPSLLQCFQQWGWWSRPHRGLSLCQQHFASCNTFLVHWPTRLPFGLAPPPECNRNLWPLTWCGFLILFYLCFWAQDQDAIQMRGEKLPGKCLRTSQEWRDEGPDHFHRLTSINLRAPVSF